MPVPYVKKQEGKNFSFPCRWFQTFDHPFEMTRVVNESQVVKNFIATPPDERQMGIEILILLYEFTFATRSQLECLLKAKGIEGNEELDNLLDKYLCQRLINKFTLGTVEMQAIPDDAFIAYCLDHGAKHVLSHFYMDDVSLVWRSTNSIRSSELVSKYLATNEFYLALLTTKGDTLTFQPTVDYSIRYQNITRDVRLSASFAIENVSSEFVVDVLRSVDMAGAWGRKVEKLTEFFERSWKRYFNLQPTLILVVEDIESAERAAQLFSLKLPGHQFFIVTDAELIKGFDNAVIYVYKDSEKRLAPAKAKFLRSTQRQLVQ